MVNPDGSCICPLYVFLQASDGETLENLHDRRGSGQRPPSQTREAALEVQRDDVLQLWLSRSEPWVGYVRSICCTEVAVTACVAWDDGDEDKDVILFSNSAGQ